MSSKPAFCQHISVGKCVSWCSDLIYHFLHFLISAVFVQTVQCTTGQSSRTSWTPVSCIVLCCPQKHTMAPHVSGQPSSCVSPSGPLSLPISLTFLSQEQNQEKEQRNERRREERRGGNPRWSTTGGRRHRASPPPPRHQPHRSWRRRPQDFIFFLKLWRSPQGLSPSLSRSF